MQLCILKNKHNMKKQITQIILLIFIMATLAISCKKDDNSSPDPTPALNTTIQQGKWKIALFNDSGNDETHYFTNYNFQFNSDGTITASSSANTVSGTWSVGNVDSQQKLILNFGATDPFEELNDDWHVLQQNSSIIKLEDVSGGNGGTDLLTFEKI